MDAPVFGPATEGEYEMPTAAPVAGLCFRGGISFLVTFPLGQQRKNHSTAAADEEPVPSRKTQSRWVSVFAGMTSIELFDQGAAEMRQRAKTGAFPERTKSLDPRLRGDDV